MAHSIDDHNKTFLNDKNDFIERIARYYMLDSVACTMHNEGYSLEGNTEESDLRWLARLIYERDGYAHWDQDSQETRDRYMRLAQITMEAIPALMSRMSSRCIRISQAVRTIIKAENLHEEYERIKSLPGRPV
jgi:hypothetical protein